MLRIVKKQPMKRDPALQLVEFLDTNRKNISAIGLWCDVNGILNGCFNYTAFNAEITVVCTEEQLSFIIMKFGAGND